MRMIYFYFFFSSHYPTPHLEKNPKETEKVLTQSWMILMWGSYNQFFLVTWNLRVCVLMQKQVCSLGLEADHFFSTPATCVTILNLPESRGWELEIESLSAHQGFNSLSVVDEQIPVRLMEIHLCLLVGGYLDFCLLQGIYRRVEDQTSQARMTKEII